MIDKISNAFKGSLHIMLALYITWTWPLHNEFSHAEDARLMQYRCPPQHILGSSRLWGQGGMSARERFPSVLSDVLDCSIGNHRCPEKLPLQYPEMTITHLKSRPLWTFLFKLRLALLNNSMHEMWLHHENLQPEVNGEYLQQHIWYDFHLCPLFLVTGC